MAFSDGLDAACELALDLPATPSASESFQANTLPLASNVIVIVIVSSAHQAQHIMDICCNFPRSPFAVSALEKLQILFRDAHVLPVPPLLSSAAGTEQALLCVSHLVV